MKPRRIVIIGGGISGLATAYYAQQRARAHGQDVELTVLEAAPRFGGLIETRQAHGCVLETGPDMFLTEQPGVTDLCAELGLSGELLPTQAAHRRSFIVRHGQLVPVPEGWFLIAPRRWHGFLTTGLVSWPGRLRMACEPFIPARRAEEEESVAAFMQRRFGREALERVGQPMVAGIYTADPHALSLRAAMPRLEAMERECGSIFKALRRGQHGAVAGTSGPRYQLFMSLRGGLGQLVEALVDHLPHAALRHSTPVQRLARGQDWRITLADGHTLEADAVCIAVPTYAAAALLEQQDQLLAAALRDIPYASVATVNVLCDREQLRHPLNGFGFVVPAVEQRPLIGCAFASVKFSGRAPQGQVLLRAFVGGALQPELIELGDPQLLTGVLSSLQELLGLRGEPRAVYIHRLRRSMPQYQLGHIDMVAALQAQAARHPGLQLTGNAYDGVGIPDCLRRAHQAAQALLATGEPA